MPNGCRTQQEDQESNYKGLPLVTKLCISTFLLKARESSHVTSRRDFLDLNGELDSSRVQPSSHASGDMTTDNPERLRRRKPPAIVSYGLLTLGGLAVIAPVLLLYRANPNRIGIRKLRTAPPPPVRQTVSVESVDTVKFRDISYRPQIISQIHDDDEIIPNPGQGPGPLHALKAFGIATCIVGATALASIAGVRAYLGTQTIDEFARLMRQKLAIIAPSLLSKIHRNVLDHDSRPIAPLQTTSSRTAVAHNQELNNVVDMNSSDWLQDIEDQLEREAARERAARLARKHNK